MIFAADWVFPVTSSPLSKHSIVVEKGRIKEIRPAAPGDPYHSKACILPGLINTHTHLAYTGLRNLFDDLLFFPWIRKLTEIKYNVLTEEDFVLSTKLGIAECIRSGITTVADMSDVPSSLVILSNSPLRGIFYWEVFGVEREAAAQTWTGLKDKYNELKTQYSTERLRLGISPHACYTVRPELYGQIAEWAIDEQLPVSFHVAESKAEEDFICRREGVIAEFLRERTRDWSFLGSSSIQHLAGTRIFQTKPLVAHAVQASKKDLELLAEADVAVAHCPKSNAKFGHGIAPVYEMQRNEICVSLGTDSAASNNRLDLFEEARFALLQQRARYQQQILSEQKMLEMMTIDGARAMGMSKEIGSLESGKFADFILVRIPADYSSSSQVLNHLIHNCSASDVLRTFIQGEEQKYEAPDVSSIYKKAK
ncbi:amidohydrolase family protein [bacterium]|nr:amidohydrolase family protein [bacterium]